MKRTSRLAALLAGVALSIAAPASAAVFTSSVIATGLNNPRGLAFNSSGDLYIAEAGLPIAGGPSTVVRGVTFHYGETGSITRVSGGMQERIISGLPSFGAPATNEAVGAHDIAFGADGTGYVVFGLGANPGVRSTDLAPNGVNLGRLYSFDASGLTGVVADIAAFEGANNPTGGIIDSNPFHLAVAPGGGLLVTDAGSNTLLNVGAGGVVSLLGAFPPRNMGAPSPPFPPVSDTVPTGVAVGPDGAYYVAELTGFPFVQGAARIYRLGEIGGAWNISVAYSGFTNLTDIEFGPDGTLYALELDSNGLATPGGSGRLLRVDPGGAHETLFTQGLVTPTGLTIGSDHAFYITNFSAGPGGRGEVLRIAAVPEPESWSLMIVGFGAIGYVLRRRPQRKPQRV